MYNKISDQVFHKVCHQQYHKFGNQVYHKVCHKVFHQLFPQPFHKLLQTCFQIAIVLYVLYHPVYLSITVSIPHRTRGREKERIALANGVSY